MPDAVLGLAGGHRASPDAGVRQSLLALGEEHQVQDVLPVHRAGVAGGSAPPASLGEDGSVFLLIVATGEARAGLCHISVVCVRGADADTDTRPMYGCVLTITTPRRSMGSDTGYAKHTWTLPSWDFPADVDMEDARHYLTPNNVHGDSKEVHLDICIIKLNVDH